MGLFENFPYANFHELNLDWILHELKELETEITNFVAINSVKYANPIIWDITSQYETNTVVLDSSGNAYLSVQPVPAGVSLDREEYWTKIGNFSALWDSVRSAITPYDEQHSTTASIDHKAGDWVWLENDLLLITKNIVAGDMYVDGSNCKKTNVHDLFVALGDSIANEVNTISSELQDEITARENGDKALDTKIATETTAREEADAALEAKIGSGTIHVINVRDFGAVGDAVHDDTAAFQAAIEKFQTNKTPIYVPNGEYRITASLHLDTTKARRLQMFGENIYATILRSETNTLFDFVMPDNTTIQESYIRNLTLFNVNAEGVCMNFKYAQKWVLSDIIFRRFTSSIIADHAWTFTVRNCVFVQNDAADPSNVRLLEQANSWLFDSCDFALPLDNTKTNSNVVILYGGATIKFVKCNFEGQRGITINPVNSVRYNIDVDTCYFEWMNGECIHCEGSDSAHTEGLSVRNCYLNNNEGATAQIAMNLSYIKGLCVIGNTAVRYNDALIYSGQGNISGSVLIAANVIDRSKMSLLKGVSLYAFEAGNAAPTEGNHTLSEVVYNSSPASGSPIGWVCIATGNPGTWKEFGTIS
jgi:hypothetical protein|nr:MAG TPA: tail spike protein [Caudoviricetes sp.]